MDTCNHNCSCATQEKVIELARQKAEEAELYTLENHQVHLTFEDGVLSSIKDDTSKGHALRIIKDGKLAMATSSPAIGWEEQLVKSAVEVAPYGKKAEFSFSKPAIVTPVKTYAPEIEEMSLEHMVDKGTHLGQMIKEITPKIKGVFYVQKNILNIKIDTSHGNHMDFQRTYLDLEYEGRLYDEGNFLTFEYFFRQGHGDYDINHIRDEVKTDYDYCLKNVPLTTGNYDVILHPTIFKDLMRPITASINGGMAEKGLSLLSNKLGEQVVDEKITIIEDPHQPYGLFSAPFDDEGVVTHPKAIIENGILKNYIYNLSTAAKKGIPATGNSFRLRHLFFGKDYETPPALDTTNVALASGDIALADMFKQVKNGVYIRHLCGTILGNHINGRIQGTIWMGYKIENGEVIGRVKDCLFAISVFDVLKNNLAGLSKETYKFCECESPYILLNNIKITSKT